MRRLIKIGIIIGTILIVIILVTTIAVSLFLGKIVKSGIESFGPKLTQTSVTLESLDLSVISGSAKIKNLIIGNPKGYNASNAICVGSATVQIDPGSMLSDKILIKSINITAPEITFEGNPLGKNNLKQIQDNINQTIDSQKEISSKESSKPTTKIQIDELIITDARVHLGTKGTRPIPNIRLKDLGKGPEGITPANVTKQIFAELIGNTLNAVGSAAVNTGKSTEKLGKEGFDKLKSIGGLFKKSTN